MTIRAAGRLVWLASEVTAALFNYFFNVILDAPANLRAVRAAWLQRTARAHLKIFGGSVKISGAIPKNGLLVSNHLSYLDIVVICSVTPTVFVSKAEVRHWPVFGALAKMGGTIFIQRERRLDVGAVNDEIEKALADSALVVVFPEGTSSNGETILPFRAPLLEPALRGGCEISVACLRYEVDDGDPKTEVCYWGDHKFFPHLLNLLGKKSVRATLHFGKFNRTTDDRKELAKQLHAAVSELKSQA
ncbi:MAG TPA: lysophospholipid acyltransferase family protein [Verrucomicrobiae bacterium]